jgi:hypothetical protein
MLRLVEELAMTERQGGGNHQETPSLKDEQPYERPTLVVIGNLHDLLAGGGTQFNDDQQCASGGGTFTTC